MALPVLVIAKLINQLGFLLPPTVELVKKIGGLIQGRGGNTSVNSRLDDLQKAIELQNSLNGQLSSQLQIVQSVLKNVQKSLKILSAAVILIGFISIVAILNSFIQ